MTEADTGMPSACPWHPAPGIAIRHDDGEKLAEKPAAGTVRLNLKVQANIWDGEPNNVVAEIPGSGPLAHEVVVLCAHLDRWHLAEGVIDNGNGSAKILETARALAALDWKPRRTARFIWFMGEEQDLFASKAYVEAHADELDDIVGVVNLDMPGSPRKFATFGHPEIVGFPKSVGTQLRGYEISEGTGNPRGSWSDHAPFMAAGVCARVPWRAGAMTRGCHGQARRRRVCPCVTEADTGMPSACPWHPALERT
ncbi:MAG: M28 family metallopeptidase [Phycisphaerae bacterium]